MYSKKFSEMNTILDNLLEMYQNTVTDGVKVATLEEVTIGHKKDNKSFSIIAPCSERSTLKVSHGSHRFQYSFDNTGKP